MYLSGPGIICGRGRQTTQLGRKPYALFIYRRNGDVHREHLGLGLLPFGRLRFHHTLKYNKQHITRHLSVVLYQQMHLSIVLFQVDANYKPRI